MAVANTFAYYNTATIAAVKCFIVQAPRDDLQFANKGVELFEFLKLENVLKVLNFGIDCKSLPDMSIFILSKDNGIARFGKCKQLFEYQHLLLNRDIWWSKFKSIFKCCSFFQHHI